MGQLVLDNFVKLEHMFLVLVYVFSKLNLSIQVSLHLIDYQACDALLMNSFSSSSLKF